MYLFIMVKEGQKRCLGTPSQVELASNIYVGEYVYKINIINQFIYIIIVLYH